MYFDLTANEYQDRYNENKTQYLFIHSAKTSMTCNNVRHKIDMKEDFPEVASGKEPIC